MTKYIAYFNDTSCQSLNLYSDIDSSESYQSFSNLDELNFLDDSCTLIVLIPSLLVSSYHSQKNDDIPKDIHLANFISDIDNKIVNQISENKFIFHEDVGYIIDKSIIDKLNKSLTLLNTNVYLTPEYSFLSKAGEDTIVEFDNKYFFSYCDGTGTSVTFDSLRDYCHIIKNTNHNYQPVIYSNTNNLKEVFHDIKPLEFSLDTFFNHEISLLPNLYSFYYSLNSIKRKFSFTSLQLALLTVSLFSILFIPSLIIVKNNKNAELYNEATFNIFTSINNDIKKVVRPRSQIDSIMSQMPSNDQDQDINLPSLDYLKQINIENIERVFIDFNQSTMTVSLNEIPSLQFNVIKTFSQQMNISILNEDIISKNNKVSGLITVSFKNE